MLEIGGSEALDAGRHDQSGPQSAVAVSGRMSLNTYQADPIYVKMTAHSQYPESLFTGSPATLEALRRAIHFPSAR